MLKEKTKLWRTERRLLKNLNVWKVYTILLFLIFWFFSLKKTFFVLWGGMKKISWIISITVSRIFGRKVWYIDDFIIHKKVRWKGIGKKIFLSATYKLEKEGTDYAFLVSRNDRKASHHLYRNLWFKIISIGIGIFAYKKFKKKFR